LKEAASADSRAGGGVPVLGNKVAGAPGKSMTRDTASARVLGAGELLCERVAAGDPLRLAAAAPLGVVVAAALNEGEVPTLGSVDCKEVAFTEPCSIVELLGVAEAA
jgi:hypothetical protein